MEVDRTQAGGAAVLQTPDLCPLEVLSVAIGPTQRTGVPESLV